MAAAFWLKQYEDAPKANKKLSATNKGRRTVLADCAMDLGIFGFPHPDVVAGELTDTISAVTHRIAFLICQAV